MKVSHLFKVTQNGVRERRSVEPSSTTRHGAAFSRVSQMSGVLGWLVDTGLFVRDCLAQTHVVPSHENIKYASYPLFNTFK